MAIQRYQQGAAEVLQLGERLTRAEVEEISAEVSTVTNARLSQVILDCRRVRLVDSAGLELICDAQAQCQRRGGQLYLAAVSPLISDVLRVTGLDNRLHQFNDVVAAAGAFAS